MNEEGWNIQDLEWIGLVESAFEQGKHYREEVNYLISDVIYDPKVCPHMIKPVPCSHSYLEVFVT